MINSNCIHALGFQPIGKGQWICRLACGQTATNKTVADLTPRFYYYNGNNPFNPASKAGVQVSAKKKSQKQLAMDRKLRREAKKAKFKSKKKEL